eukprot:s889_g8.t2
MSYVAHLLPMPIAAVPVRHGHAKCSGSVRPAGDDFEAGPKPTAAQFHQMQVELERSRRQLAEERQVTQKLRELLVMQNAEYSQEITSLNNTNEHLRGEILDLIQDLEATLCGQPGQTPAAENLATMKRAVSKRCLTSEPIPQETGSLKGLAIDGAKEGTEKLSCIIPNWNEIMRHIGGPAAKEDDGHSIGSLLTRSGSSVSSTPSLEDVPFILVVSDSLGVIGDPLHANS